MTFCAIQTESDLECYAMAAGIQCYYCECYQAGLTRPAYPVPALLVDSVSDLGERWSSWMDHPDIGRRW